MAINPLLNAEAGANTDAATIGQPPTGNSGATALSTAGGSIAVSTAQAAHGTRSMLFTATTTSGGCYASYDLGSPRMTLGFRLYFRWSAWPSVNTSMAWFGNGSSQRSSVEITPAGLLRFRDDDNLAAWDGSGSTSTGAFSLNTWHRLDGYMTAGAGTGSFRLAGYNGDSTTPITGLDSGLRASQNTGADGFSTWRVGPKTSTGTGTGTMYIDLDSSGWDPAATGLPGPWQETLGTPIVSLGAATRPSTVGGDDGTQTVTWGSISGAASYDAYIATGDTPGQEDFDLVQAGVTSPYTFIDLSAGVRAYGIKAKG